MRVRYAQGVPSWNLGLCGAEFALPAMTSIQNENRGAPIFAIAALIVTAAFIGGGLWVARYVAAREVVVPSDAGDAAATPVRVVAVERRPLVVRAEFHGFLVPFEEITTSAEVAGEIVEQRIDVSDEVGEGQILFKIDDAIRGTSHDQALAVLDRARSETRLAEANWHRIKGLDEEQASPIERQEGETRFLAAQANERQAEAAVRQSSLLLERTDVSSPINGVISRLYARRGEFTQPGQPLADVIEIARLKLLGEIEDREMVWVRVGMPVILTTEIFPGEQFEGHVHRISPQALSTNRKFEVEIELANPQRRLHPGFFMKGLIVRPDIGEEDAVEMLVAPREAVVELFGEQFVHVVRPTVSETDTMPTTLTATRTAVVVLPIPSDPRFWRVVEGLEEGELVVTKGVQHLSAETAVRITE